MSGVPKIVIAESVETLRNLMKEQKTSLNYAKVQALYLLKVGAVETVRHLAVVIGRGEATIHRWLKLYREGGLEKLLEKKRKTGRPPKISVDVAALIQQELKAPEGFSSYKEVRFWLWAIQGINLSYTTVYKFIRYELKAKLKVPRLRNYKQVTGAIETFKKLLPRMLKSLKNRALQASSLVRKFSYWFEDETRLGLRTIKRRKLTLSGVKPIGLVQEEFEYYYVYGVVDPKIGRSFFYEFSHLDTSCFEEFLHKFSQAYPDEFHIVQVDNAPCHTSKQLNIPSNIILLFQPTYCPEVNPIERLWEYIKEFLSWQIFDNLEELRNQVRKILESLREDILKSLGEWEYIKTALSLSNL